MQFIVLGAGALGSIFAAHLIRAGHQVSVVARGRRAEQLRSNGLILSGLAEFTVPCDVVTDPHGLERADVVIVAVKTYDNPSALRALDHVRASCVFSVQNGMEKDEQLAAAFGPEATLGAVGMLGGTLRPDGAVSYTLDGPSIIGELPSGGSERVDRIVDALANSGLVAERSEDILSVEWSKFVGWSGVSTVAILTRLETYKFLSHEGSAGVAARVMRETAALAKADGVELLDRPPLPCATVDEGSEADATRTLLRAGEALRERAPALRQSALQDVDRGRRTEVEDTLDYTRRRARALGIETPTLDLCHALITAVNAHLQRAGPDASN